MANLALVYAGVNFRDGYSLTSPVRFMSSSLVYAPVIGLTKVTDPDGYYWLKLHLDDGTEACVRADKARVIGDFTSFGLCGYDTLDWAQARLAVALAKPVVASPVPVVVASGLLACPVRPAYDSNDYGNVYAGVTHDGVDLAGAAGSDVRAGIRGVVIRAMKSAHGDHSFSDEGIALNNSTALNDPGWGYGLGNHVIVRVTWEDLPKATQSALLAAGQVKKFVYVAFGHLKTIAANITTGVWIEADTVLGQRGDSGNANGAHVHLWCAVGDLEQPSNPFVQCQRFNPHWLYGLPAQGKAYN